MRRNQDVKKSVFLDEDQENEDISVLKNSMVAEHFFRGPFGAFEARFRRIVALVDQKIPMKQFEFDFMDHHPADELRDLARIRDHYLGIIFIRIITITIV